MVDSSIQRVKHNGEWRLYVQLAGTVEPVPRPVYGIWHVFGRRSSVFKNVANPMTVDGKVVGIIKEQYIMDGHPSEELNAVQHIHADGTVPGIVVALHQETVERFGRNPGEYRKDRLVEQDMGKPLIEASNVRDLLIGLYDTLEISRYIYSERKVLQRDISNNNACINKAGAAVDSNIPASKLCCARYLLGETENTTAFSSSLIDFDHSEILEQKEDQSRMGRTGTPVFIARAVGKGRPLENELGYKFLAMPSAPNIPQRGYQEVLFVHFKRFLGSKTVFVDSQDHNDDTEKHAGLAWRHQLYHDAESVFWLLFWWAVVALPQGEDVDECQIPLQVWFNLTRHTHGDHRDTLIADMFEVDSQIIHPRYASIRPLIRALWFYIKYDHYWAPRSGPLHEPDFVHEAFQRIILSFIVENEKSAFLTLQRDLEKTRSVENITLPHRDNVYGLSGVESIRNTPGRSVNVMKRDNSTQETLDDKNRSGKRTRFEVTP